MMAAHCSQQLQTPRRRRGGRRDELPGRVALREELRRGAAALQAVKAGRSYLHTAACAAHAERAACEGGVGHHGCAASGTLHAHSPAAALAALTLRVPGLEHLAAQAASEAAASLAGAGGPSLAEEAPPRESAETRVSSRRGAHLAPPRVSDGAASRDGQDALNDVADSGYGSGDDGDATATAIRALREPGAGLASAIAAFNAARVAADEDLLAALAARRAAGGADAYARSFAALGAAISPRQGRAAPPVALDEQRWRLEAEALRLRAALAACARQRWYARALQLAADGGRGGVSRGEAAVLERVKRVIEAGQDFGAPQLFDLLLSLRRDELEAPDVQRCVLLLREEAGVAPGALRAFLRERGLPTPLALSAGGAAALGRAAAASSYLGGPRGTSASARPSALFTPRVSHALR